MAYTPCFEGTGARFDPWSWNWIPHAATKTCFSQINKNFKNENTCHYMTATRVCFPTASPVLHVSLYQALHVTDTYVKTLLDNFVITREIEFLYVHRPLYFFSHLPACKLLVVLSLCKGSLYVRELHLLSLICIVKCHPPTPSVFVFWSHFLIHVAVSFNIFRHD